MHLALRMPSKRPSPVVRVVGVAIHHAAAHVLPAPATHLRAWHRVDGSVQLRSRPATFASAKGVKRRHPACAWCTPRAQLLGSWGGPLHPGTAITDCAPPVAASLGCLPACTASRGGAGRLWLCQGGHPPCATWRSRLSGSGSGCPWAGCTGRRACGPPAGLQQGGLGHISTRWIARVSRRSLGGTWRYRAGGEGGGGGVCCVKESSARPSSGRGRREAEWPGAHLGIGALTLRAPRRLLLLQAGRHGREGAAAGEGFMIHHV